MICRKLSEAMGGSISCASERGRGSTFTVEIQDSSSHAGLPLETRGSEDPFRCEHKQSDDHHTALCEAPSHRTNSGYTKIPTQPLSSSVCLRSPLPRVLVVDDEIICGKVTKAMIESCNVIVDVVSRNCSGCRPTRESPRLGYFRPSLRKERRSLMSSSFLILTCQGWEAARRLNIFTD